MKNLGSTIFLVLGVITFMGLATTKPTVALSGVHMILGALAYRSAKKRYLGEAEFKWIRIGLENVALILIVLSVVLQRDLKYAIVTDPFPNLILPLLIFIAYFLARQWKLKRVEDPALPGSKE